MSGLLHMKRKRVTKKMIKSSQKIFGKDPKTMECSKCFDLVMNVDAGASLVICGRCVQRMVAPPEALTKPVKEKRPRGWQFRKEYTSPSGKIYHYGKEVKNNDQKTTKEVAKSSKGKKKAKPPTTHKKSTSTSSKRKKPSTIKASTKKPRKKK